MAEEISNEDIFDWIVGFENECIERVRDEVILTAEYNYGSKGRKVAEKYYKAIDGEETVDDILEDKECNDCKERAKKLLEKTEFLTKISEILYDDSISEILKMSNISLSDIIKLLDSFVENIINDSCFKIDDLETKRKLKTAILLNCCQQLQKQ